MEAVFARHLAVPLSPPESRSGGGGNPDRGRPASPCTDEKVFLLRGSNTSAGSSCWGLVRMFFFRPRGSHGHSRNELEKILLWDYFKCAELCPSLRYLGYHVRLEGRNGRSFKEWFDSDVDHCFIFPPLDDDDADVDRTVSLLLGQSVDERNFLSRFLQGWTALEEDDPQEEGFRPSSEAPELESELLLGGSDDVQGWIVRCALAWPYEGSAFDVGYRRPEWDSMVHYRYAEGVSLSVPLYL